MTASGEKRTSVPAYFKVATSSIDSVFLAVTHPASASAAHANNRTFRSIFPLPKNTQAVCHERRVQGKRKSISVLELGFDEGNRTCGVRRTDSVRDRQPALSPHATRTAAATLNLNSGSRWNLFGSLLRGCRGYRVWVYARACSGST